MNDSTRTQLKIIVERAVRPVHATLSRKRRMREELLGHVSAVYEEEAARLGDERSAVVATEQRFGNAAELTVQLQASVPWHDRAAWYWESFLKKPGTSPLYRASRLALMTGAGCTVLIGLAFLLGEQPSLFVLSFLFAIFMVLSASWFLFLPLIDWLQRRLFDPPGWAWRKAAALSAATGVFLLPCWGFGLFISSVFNLRVNVVDSLPMLGLAAVVMPLAFVHLARATHAEARYYQEWAGLVIEPSCLT